MQFDTEATICAIATGHEHGCRGAIRASGKGCLQILEEMQAVPAVIRNAKSPTRARVDWDTRSRLGTIAVDIWYWPTQRSYTGAPSIEVHTLGNTIILNRMVEQLCEGGARLALPGEFTLRAFLAGRLDLTQCEAVLGVIEAKSQASFDIALRQLAGGLAIPLKTLRQSLVDLLADIEAGLDFVDEDIQFISREQVLERLENTRHAVQILANQLTQRHASQHPPKVALMGLPNAGKSSLINAIANQDAAIVSASAGTTRDFVRVRRTLPNGEIDLIDTAGVDAQNMDQSRLQEIDRLAQRQSLQQREEAELILYCIDSQLDHIQKLEQLAIALVESNGSLDQKPFMHQTGRSILAENVWIVWTKSDQATTEDELRRLPIPFQNAPTFVTSAIDTNRLADLLVALNDWLLKRDHELSSVAPMTATRCKDSLRSALDALHAAYAAADNAAGDELVASEIRLALDQLASVAGEVYTDDVLDSLFSRFCIGK